MLRRPLVQLALSLLVLILLVWLFSNIALYIVLSLIITAILLPLTNYINQTQIYKMRVPRLIAVFISFAAFAFVITLFITLFIPVVSDQVDVLSTFNYDDVMQKLTVPIQSIESFLIEHELSSQDPGFLVNNIRGEITDFILQVNLSNVLNNLLSLTGRFFIGGMAVVFITFFFLFQIDRMRKNLISLIPNRYFEVSIAAFTKIERLLSNYLLGLLFQAFSIFTLASLGLTMVGTKYAFTIAAFAAVANVVPYLGPILGALFGIVIGLSTGDFVLGTQEANLMFLKIFLVFVVVQLIDNMVLQPLIFSKSVRAHPLEIFVIIFAGASLAGIPGMIAAIPIYTILRVSFIELYGGYKQYTIFNKG